MKRVPQNEWLDHDVGTPAEIEASLSDLRNINRWFGGIATTRYLLRKAMREARLSSATVLEAAAGDGFSVQQAAGELKTDGLAIDLTLLDRQSSHLASNNGTHTIIGDALQMPFSDGSFDFVSCALFVHHLDPVNVVRFVTEGLRVCRRAVLLNDLRRSAAHIALVYLGFPLFRSRITRHDSVASVRQSYTPSEIVALMKRTPARRVEIANHYLCRMAVTVWK